MNKLVVFLLILLLNPARAAAQFPDTIQFAEEGDWPPFTYQSDGEITSGLSYDLIQLIFNRLDLRAVIEVYPQKRMLHQLKAGLKDGATVISINQERLRYLIFSDPVFEKKGLIYYRSDRPEPLHWETFNDLKSVHMAIVAGHNYGDEFHQAVRQIPLQVEYTPYLESSFKMLMSGRVEALLAVNWSAQHFLRDRHYQSKIISAEKPYYVRNYHIGLSKKSSFVPLMPEINRVINEIKRDGALTLLLTRYQLKPTQ